MKIFFVALISVFTMASFTPTVANAQSGGGNPNPSQVQAIIDDIYDDVTPEQREMIEEAQSENYTCVVSALVAAGFTYPTGGYGGSISTFLSTLSTCTIQ